MSPGDRDPGVEVAAWRARPGGGWNVAREGGSRSRAADFLSFGIAQPFVFVEYGTLNATASRELSDQTLRDFFLPVAPAARQNAASQGFPATSFRQLRDLAQPTGPFSSLVGR
jgi:hypothetical protein